MVALSQKEQKALVIAPEPFFSYRGTPFSVYYRTLVCAEKGLEIDLLTYGEGQDVDIPGVRIRRLPRFAFLGKIPIGPSWPKLFLDGFLVLWTLGLLIRHRYAFVHAHEEAVFFCAILKPLFRFKLVYDMHSSLPQQLTNFKFTKARWLIGLFARLERLALRRADAVITICPELADYALGELDDPEKHFLIENSIFEQVSLKGAGAGEGASAADVDPAMEARQPLVVYAGTMEPYQGMDILVRAFGHVAAEQPEAHLLLVGGRPDQVAEYAELASSLGISQHVTVRERVSQAAVRQVLDWAAVQMSPRSAGTNTPLKVYQQLASGVPLVATRIRSHTQVLDDAVTYLVDPEPRAMADGILQAIADGKPDNPRARAAIELYERKYSRAIYEAKIEALLKRLGAVVPMPRSGR